MKTDEKDNVCVRVRTVRMCVRVCTLLILKQAGHFIPHRASHSRSVSSALTSFDPGNEISASVGSFTSL